MLSSGSTSKSKIQTRSGTPFLGSEQSADTFLFRTVLRPFFGLYPFLLKIKLNLYPDLWRNLYSGTSGPKKCLFLYIYRKFRSKESNLFSSFVRLNEVDVD